MTTWLHHLRAAAVLFHLAVVAVMSIPVPPPAIRGEKADPRLDADLAPWGDAAESIGIPRATLFAAIFGFTRAEARLLGVLRAPLRPYVKAVGAEQGWLMFGSVARDVARLEILVREGDAWTPLFVARTDDATWRRTLFDQERMRTLVYNFGQHRAKSKLEALATWVARQVHAERPAASAVRVQMRKVHIPGPEVVGRTGTLELGGTYWVIERKLTP